MQHGMTYQTVQESKKQTKLCAKFGEDWIKFDGQMVTKCSGVKGSRSSKISTWGRRCLATTWTEPHPASARDSLEVARRADVRLGQPLLLPLALFLPLGEGGVHNVVHLRVVMVTLNVADLWVFDVDCSHGQRRAWKMAETMKLWFK